MTPGVTVLENGPDSEYLKVKKDSHVNVKNTLLYATVLENGPDSEYLKIKAM